MAAKGRAGHGGPRCSWHLGCAWRARCVWPERSAVGTVHLRNNLAKNTLPVLCICTLTVCEVPTDTGKVTSGLTLLGVQRGSCRCPVTIFSSTQPHLILGYVCFCLKTLYVTCTIDPLTSRAQPTALLEQSVSNTHIFSQFSNFTSHFLCLGMVGGQFKQQNHSEKAPKSETRCSN